MSRGIIDVAWHVLYFKFAKICVSVVSEIRVALCNMLCFNFVKIHVNAMWEVGASQFELRNIYLALRRITDNKVGARHSS